RGGESLEGDRLVHLGGGRRVGRVRQQVLRLLDAAVGDIDGILETRRVGCGLRQGGDGDERAQHDREDRDSGADSVEHSGTSSLWASSARSGQGGTRCGGKVAAGVPGCAIGGGMSNPLHPQRLWGTARCAESPTAAGLTLRVRRVVTDWPGGSTAAGLEARPRPLRADAGGTPPGPPAGYGSLSWLPLCVECGPISTTCCERTAMTLFRPSLKSGGLQAAPAAGSPGIPWRRPRALCAAWGRARSRRPAARGVAGRRDVGVRDAGKRPQLVWTSRDPDSGTVNLRLGWCDGPWRGAGSGDDRRTAGSSGATTPY